MSLKRVLFAGPLWYGSSALMRLKGLQALGLEVLSLDTTPWVGTGSRLALSLRQRLYFGVSVRAMNAALLRAAPRAAPDLVWIEKGTWIYPSTLQELRQHSPFVVHYNTDDVFARGGHFWLHRRGIESYDLCLTTNRWNVLEIPQRLGVKTLRVAMGYDQDLSVRSDSNTLEEPTQRVVFAGHWEPHTERFIEALRANGVEVRVWGANWRKARQRSLRAARPLPYDEYGGVIARAAVALCFLSRRNRNESTMRSFEIPALGTCMLAERTAEHEFIYGDGDGAALFSSEHELLDKTRYYLTHAEERQAVAARGHARCKGTGFTWADHIRREWPILERLLTGEDKHLSAEDDRPFWPGFREGLPFRKESREASR